MAAKDFKDLIVWQKAMELAVEVYRLTKQLPKEETYVLSDQMRRAVISISSNIAEGQQRITNKEFANFLSIARGSNAELETQLLICVKLCYLKDSDIEKALGYCTEVGRMLHTLIQKQYQTQ